MMQISERVWEVLQQHKGRETGIRCRDLAEAVDAGPREIRDAVTELRRAGVPVCGHPKAGYFIAATKAELDETCGFLHGRAMTSLEIEAALKRTHVAELLGQMKLGLDLTPEQMALLPEGE
jgi:predicted DNA-binding transcriptional regulator YafY